MCCFLVKGPSPSRVFQSAGVAIFLNHNMLMRPQICCVYECKQIIRNSALNFCVAVSSNIALTPESVFDWLDDWLPPSSERTPLIRCTLNIGIDGKRHR